MSASPGRKYLLFALALVSLNQCDAAETTCADKLVNTVVNEGSPVAFPRANNNLDFQWQAVSSSEFFNRLKNITNFDDHVTLDFIDICAVNKTHLFIANATSAPPGKGKNAAAGLYLLRYRNPDCVTAANLIVIKNGGPVCSSDTVKPKHKDTVVFSCTADYAAAVPQPNVPNFAWFNSKGEEVEHDQPIPSRIDPFIQRSRSLLTIDGGDNSRYTCTVTFSTPIRSKLTFVSTDAPTYSASCTVSRNKN